MRKCIVFSALAAGILFAGSAFADDPPPVPMKGDGPFIAAGPHNPPAPKPMNNPGFKDKVRPHDIGKTAKRLPPRRFDEPAARGQNPYLPHTSPAPVPVKEPALKNKPQPLPGRTGDEMPRRPPEGYAL